MGRLNGSPVSPRTHKGGVASRTSEEEQLRRTLMTCMLWEQSFYEDGEAVADRIVRLVPRCKPENVGAMAVDARLVQNLRHAPLLVADAMCKAGGPHRALVDQVLELVIERPDELAEFLAIYWRDGKVPLAAKVKKGLARAFTKFDAYQLAKYNRDSAIKLRDVLFLSHAKPATEEQAQAWKQLIAGTLPIPGTWENVLSAGADKRAAWTMLLEGARLGGLALLRNLRNMEQAGVNRDLIRRAIRNMRTDRILPFRFIAAAKYTPWAEPELEEAMFRNLAEVPKLPGNTMLLVDKSGSMQNKLSDKSDMTRYDAAAGLAMLLREICEQCTVMVFNRNAEEVAPRRGFALRDALGHPAGGTYLETAKLAADRKGYDRIIILTDEQVAINENLRSKPLGPGYVVNIAVHQNGIGYGDYTHINGWSEAVVDYIRAAEEQ